MGSNPTCYVQDSDHSPFPVISSCIIVPTEDTPQSRTTQMIGQLLKSEMALEFPLWIVSTETQQHFYARTLIDSGASSNFVDMQFAAHKFIHYRLEEPIPIQNADGSKN